MISLWHQMLPYFYRISLKTALEIVPGIGHCPVEYFLCLAAVNNLLAIMTDCLKFTDIYFFLASCKLNTELNEQILMNVSYSTLSMKLLVTCCSSSVRRNFFLSDWCSLLFWLFSIHLSTHFRVFQIALRGGGWEEGGGGGTRNFAGEGGFFFTGRGFAQGIFFRSFVAFVVLKLIFHIYWTSVSEN